MKEVPVLMATSRCPVCDRSELQLKNAELPYEVKLIPQDEEALEVAQLNGIMKAGEFMYIPSKLDEVFTVNDYLNGKVDL